jgi:hypothetical protein
MHELDHVLGFKVRLKQTKSGFFLEGPMGEIASIGDGGQNAVLSPRDQEAICENLGVDAALLGLNPRPD